MKIAFFVNLFPCLSETFILNQITGLIDRGHSVDIFARLPENEQLVHQDIIKYNLLTRTFYYTSAMPANILLRSGKAVLMILKNIHRRPLTLLNSLNIYKFGKEAASLSIFYKVIPFLKINHYDIIHCQFGSNGDLAVLLNLVGALKGKVITTFHGYDIRLGIERGGSIYQRLFKEGDLFLAISDYNYRNLVNLGLDERKIVFHPVGIDFKNFSWKWESGSNLKIKKFRLISVGRLVKEKGHHYSIEAVHKVLQRRPELELEYVIIGSGPLKVDIMRLIENLNLVGVVRLFGPGDQAQVVAEMKKSDIFMLPSVAEALPVVAMEAQAVGLPMIASAVGSVDQIVLNGKSGFLVPERDVNGLAERLMYLIEHPERWPEMGRAGRRYVEEKFDINKLNDRLVDLYRQLLDGELWNGSE